MVWFFERSAKLLELETRYDNQTAEYVVEVRWPDTAPTIERFPDAVAFRNRLLAIERNLIDKRWRRDGPPIILPEGWPDKKPSQ